MKLTHFCSDAFIIMTRFLSKVPPRYLHSSVPAKMRNNAATHEVNQNYANYHAKRHRKVETKYTAYVEAKPTLTKLQETEKHEKVVTVIHLN